CILLLFSVWFFFSSRRRHTRSTRDWSSDVCSSDLPGVSNAERPSGLASNSCGITFTTISVSLGRRFVGTSAVSFGGSSFFFSSRSEERRVGKECCSLFWSLL